jgi:hypothetical protein
LSYQRGNITELAYELKIRPELLYRWCSEFAGSEGASFPGNGNKKLTEEQKALLPISWNGLSICCIKHIHKDSYASIRKLLSLNTSNN